MDTEWAIVSFRIDGEFPYWQGVCIKQVEFRENVRARGQEATMADRIRMFWILLLENRSQNNIFLLQ